MKTIFTFAVIAALSVAAIGAISSQALSTPMLLGAVDTDNAYLQGHVEYVLRDSDGTIKQYIQTDNQVVDRGDQCVANLISGATGATCTNSSNNFTWIGIANGTSGINDAATTIGDAANSATDGLMAMRQCTPTTANNAGNGATITCGTPSGDPFSFSSTTTTNATQVQRAGLFNADCTANAQNVCTGAAGDMFAAQAIDVTTTSGDTLAVTWTITVGGAN
jgi:hypothetical protein